MSIKKWTNKVLLIFVGHISLPAVWVSEQITGLVNFILGFISGLFDLDVNQRWYKFHVLLYYPEVKLTNIFKVPEVPKKPVFEEEPAIPVPEKAESPPPEGTYKTINGLAAHDNC